VTILLVCPDEQRLNRLKDAIHSAGFRTIPNVTESLDAQPIERVVTFGDVGAKDVTEFLAEHTVEDLVRRMGSDWVRMPDGRRP